MHSKVIDYIIVGQGIAGSLLACHLLNAGKKILVIDEFNPNSSSNIAAGVINPVTGRKMVKSWMIDEVLPYAKTTYKSLEKLLGLSFFFDKEIYKLFSSTDDVLLWNKRKEDTEYQNYLSDIISLNENDSTIAAPFSAGMIKNACWLDVPVFTKACRNYFKEKQVLVETKFEISSIADYNAIVYDTYKAKGIIFCEGYKAYNNPLFSWIPFALAKGEQLLIESQHLQLNNIINKNIFIVPKGNDKYSVGSTFIWNDTEESITETGRAELISKLNKIIRAPYTIIEEKAGIRPAMMDRRPVLGAHPNYKNVYIFNGFGTKGVSLAPYLAAHFVEFLNDKVSILDEISINRFVK